MKFLLPAICLMTSALNGAWVIEDIPTTIQYSGFFANVPGKEMTSAYQAIYNSSGVKTGENIAIAYRSKYLYVTQRQGTGWSGVRFDDAGRYPSIAVDSLGKPHMTYFRTSNNKLYYAHTVGAGTGHCGPNMSWACEEVPATIFGSPIGHSAITVNGSTIQILVETASGNPTYPSMVSRLTKTIGAVGWNAPQAVSLSSGLVGLDIKIDTSGSPQVLLNSVYLDWYRISGSNVVGIGPLYGNGAFDMTSSGAPRVCYRQFGSNWLIYANSNGSSYWTETILDYDIGALGSCSIAVPVDNGRQLFGYYNPRIAYYDAADSSVKYAATSILSQSWFVQTVAAATGTRTINLHLDKQAGPSIIYFDSSLLKLRLAQIQ